MHKSQEVVGLTVIDAKTGTEVGIVNDLLFDATPSLQGILLEENGWLRRKKFIPKEGITIGSDIVLLEGTDQVKPYDDKLPLTSVCTGSKCFKGRSLLLVDGTELGRVENVYFMEEVGTIVGYELSDGLISDLTIGRRLFKTSQPLSWGDNVLITSIDLAQVQK